MLSVWAWTGTTYRRSISARNVPRGRSTKSEPGCCRLGKIRNGKIIAPTCSNNVVLFCRREREIFNKDSSDDDGKVKFAAKGPKKGPSGGGGGGGGGHHQGPAGGQKKVVAKKFKSLEPHRTKAVKKNYKRKCLKEGGARENSAASGNKKLSPRKGRRKSQSVTATDKDDKEVNVKNFSFIKVNEILYESR